MRFALSILSIIGIPILASSQTLHYTITFNGSEAGAVVYSSTPDGKVKGTANLTIMGTVLKEDLTALFTNGKLVSSDCISTNPSGDTTMHYAEGKLVVHTSKEDKTIPYVPKQDFYGGNLLSPLWKSSVAAALASFTKDPGQASITIPTYLVDIGQEIPVLYRKLPSRKATVNGKLEVTNSFQTNMGGVQAELDAAADGTIVAFDVPGQKLRMILDGWAGLYIDPLSKYPELSQPTYKVKTEDNVSMKTRDGVELVATVFRPDSAGKFPAILTRTPYLRSSQASDALFYASRGYVFISQDVRGRGGSKGEWDPFVHEGEDGADAIDWIASQPWSDGNVGMIGGSYGGYVQWSAAVKQPKALKCLVPQVSPPDAMHNLPYDFGVPFLWADLWWSKLVAGEGMDMSSFQSPLPHPEKAGTLPLGDADLAVLGKKVPFLSKWLSRTTIGDWKGFDFYQHLEKANVPALQISGWFDGDGIGTKLIWAKERSLGRSDQWLIEGPWTHDFNTASSRGTVDYGPGAIIDLDSLYLRWFDTWLKGKDVGISKVPKAMIFVTGANKWQSLTDWPAPEEKTETLYLTGSGSADSRKLLEEAPAKGADSYTYDPAKDGDSSILTKMYDQQQSFSGIVPLFKERNGGFYVYKSSPLKEDLTIAGPAVVKLNFQTNAQDTDFFAMILDIDSKGVMRAFSVPGKIRCSYLKGVDKRVPLVPGKVYQALIEPWEFAHQIKAGHQIGVMIYSTSFPMYARNLGTAEPILTGTHMVAQHNQLLFGNSDPSSISFKVLDLK